MGLLVIDPGLSTTVQDAGRPGYREWGVPLGGSFDRASADLANALLGNSLECAVLELTFSGGIYQSQRPLALALAGAPMEAKVVLPDSTEHRLVLPVSLSLRDGHRLILGRTLDGARTYLAVAGGWQTRERLGSRSSELRVAAGDLLPAASGTIPTRHPVAPPWRSVTDDPIRIIDGPDARLHPHLDALYWAGRRYRVSTRLNRMGLRLEGEPLAFPVDPGRLSSPVAPGAVQVAGGQLIVLGVACGTMGGYPHVAHVISADLDRLGQLKPGDAIQFHRVTVEEARRLDENGRTERRRLTTRLVLVARSDRPEISEQR